MVSVKDLIEELQKFKNPEAEICLHIWDSRKRESKFERLDIAISNNIESRFVLIEGHGLVN